MSTKNRKQKEAALLKTKDEDVTIIDQQSLKANSKKRTNSGKFKQIFGKMILCFISIDRDESKRRSTKPNSNIEPPKKKQKRDKSKKIKSFFDDEAEEGEESGQEERKQVVKGKHKIL